MTSTYPTHKVVFIDPQDDSYSFYWPALIVEKSDYEYLDSDLELPTSIGMCLVCLLSLSDTKA